MTTGAQQLEVRRVYSSSPVKAAAVAVGDRARAQFSVLGVLYLLLAGVWIYLTWWPADRLIITNLSTTTLIHLSATGALTGLIGPAPAEVANPAPPEGTQAVLGPAEDPPAARGEQELEEVLARSRRVLIRIGATMEGWFAIMTVVGGWLALCGGAAATGFAVVDGAKRRRLMRVAVILALVAGGIAVKLWTGGSASGLSRTMIEMTFVILVMLVCWLLAVTLPRRSARRTAVVLTLVLICGIALTAMELGRGYPAGAPRIAAALGMVIATLMGVVAAHRLAGLRRAAIVLTLLAVLGTAVLLKVADSLGGVHTHEPTAATYVAIGAAQAAWVGVLLGARALGWR